MMSNADQADAPQIPGFTFDSRIGGGGFADVYLFRQHNPNRQVAVKVLKHEHLNDESLRQFRGEADIMAEVSQHPYIVTVFTAGIASDGRPYLVMEYYPRPHFGERAKGGRMSVIEVLKVGVQLCSAVQTAHDSSILHRDIKPANILTSDYGHPGLTDFGIAGVRQDGVFDSASAVTIPYSPPEILSGSDDTGSERTDVYSLSATIYALLSGRPPHWVAGGDNSQAALTTRILNGDRVPVTGRPDTGPLEHLLSMALSRDPDHRPQTAFALAELLRDVELRLQLPPTPFETRGGHEVDRLLSSDTNANSSDEDGTRLSPQVVQAQSDRPPRFSKPTEGVDVAGGLEMSTDSIPSPPTTARQATPDGRSPFAPKQPATGQPSSSSLATTVPDPVAAPDLNNPLTSKRVSDVSRFTEITPTADPREQDGSKNSSLLSRIPPLAFGILGASLLVILVVLVMANAGSDATRPKDQDTATTVEEIDDQILPMSIDPPSNIVTSWEPTKNVLTASWEPPAQNEAYELHYRVTPSLPDGSTTSITPAVSAAFTDKAFELDSPNFSIDLSGLEGEPPCIRVQSIGPQQTGSELSDISCPE